MDFRRVFLAYLEAPNSILVKIDYEGNPFIWGVFGFPPKTITPPLPRPRSPEPYEGNPFFQGACEPRGNRGGFSVLGVPMHWGGFLVSAVPGSWEGVYCLRVMITEWRIVLAPV